jgi:hypothetical protein
MGKKKYKIKISPPDEHERTENMMRAQGGGI